MPAIMETALVPETGESEADFSQRVHDAMAGDLGTDGAQELAFSIWDEHHGPSEEQQIADRQFPPDKFHRVQWVPEFSAHTTRSTNPQTGEKRTEVYDRRALESIVARCNHRIADTRDFVPLTDHHTPDDDARANGVKNPDVLGFAGPFRIGLIGNKEPRWAIFATEHHHNSDRERIAKLNRRSPEVWLEEKMEKRFLDPIACLGAETPRLDLGLGRFSCRTHSGRLVEKYSATFPGANSVSLPAAVGGKKRHYESDPNGGEAMSEQLSPETVQQVVDAVMATDLMQKLAQQFGGNGPDPMAGGDPAGMAPGGDLPGDAGPPMDPSAGVPPAPAPEAAAPPSGPDAGGDDPGPPDDDWDDAEKAHYACMNPAMKKNYRGFRKQYAAEGSVVNDAALDSPAAATVDDSTSVAKNSRAAGNDRARVGRMEAEIADLRKRVQTAEREKQRTERYSRLQARAHEFAFDVDEEFELTEGYDDAKFNRHCDQIIVSRYHRIPAGVDVRTDFPLDPPAVSRGRDKKSDAYRKKLRDRTIAIYSARARAKNTISYDEAKAIAEQEIDADK